MPEFQEGGPPSEESEERLRSELRERELRKLSELIRRVPYPPNVLDSRTEERFLEFLEKNPEMAAAKELWVKYRSAGGSEGQGGMITFTPRGGERMSVSRQEIEALERLRSQVQAATKRQVYEELANQPFIAGDAIRRGVVSCDDCRQAVQMGWRKVMRSTKENPAPIDFTGVAYIFSDEPEQQYRQISFLDLHKLEKHPSTARVSLEDWIGFLGQTELPAEDLDR